MASYREERACGSSKGMAFFLSTEAAVISCVPMIVLIVVVLIWVVGNNISNKKTHEQCDAAGGVYVSQRWNNPLCLDESALLDGLD